MSSATTESILCSSLSRTACHLRLVVPSLSVALPLLTPTNGKGREGVYVSNFQTGRWLHYSQNRLIAWYLIA